MVSCLFLLTACAGATAPMPAPAAPSEDVLPQPVTSDELVGTGLVVERDGEGPVFCLGAVGDSAVPACLGPRLIGWDWGAAEQSKTLLDATWGEYAVHGIWDGVAFTPTRDPIPLSVYDRAAYDHPRGDADNPGSLDEAEALRVLDDISKTYDSDSAHIEVMAPINGYTWVQVIYDDGQVQAYLDEKYGSRAVAVTSALRPVD